MWDWCRGCKKYRKSQLKLGWMPVRSVYQLLKESKHMVLILQQIWVFHITYEKCVYSIKKQSKLTHIILVRGHKKTLDPLLTVFFFWGLVYSCIRTIIIIDVSLFSSREKSAPAVIKRPLWLFNQLSQPELSATPATTAQLHHPVMSAVLSTLSTDCWALYWHPALTEALLAGNPNCLWFTRVGHKTTRVAALTCQRVINTKRRKREEQGGNRKDKRGQKHDEGVA